MSFSVLGGGNYGRRLWLWPDYLSCMPCQGVWSFIPQILFGSNRGYVGNTIFQPDCQNPVHKCRNVDKMISKIPSASVTLSSFSKPLSSRKPSQVSIPTAAVLTYMMVVFPV